MSLINHLKLKFDFTFEDLYKHEGLLKLDQKFLEFVKRAHPETAWQQNINNESDLVEKAQILEEFLVELFNIKNENDELKKRHDELQKIYHIRREFVQRIVAKKFSEAPAGLDGYAILKELKIPYEVLDELEKTLAEKIFALLQKEKNFLPSEKDEMEILMLYSSWALYSPEGKRLHKNGSLFILPKKIDHQNLVNPCHEKSNRQGFDLTDKGFGLNRALAETHYCIFCHKQKKDSCRSGIFEKDSKNLKLDPLGVELHGCPLDEKISEMNLLKSQGFTLAAFAVACLDNPMLAGTGHRICNDCMKSCIFQKQDPVDIPQIETRVTKDVLALPYGFEIYSLLTRWNPLRPEQKLPEKNSGKKILVCGLGPAGYTLAHYLLNEGHIVVAIDGLKIEPLNPEISGIDAFGNRSQFRPIKFLDEIYETLSNRLLQGFGGVAEYGITVRWDKNFLKIIRLLLERRKNFRMFGGIRFGSTITDETAFKKYNFDHVALCIGAGRPNLINLKNNFAKGIRMASDFLMSLQLTGAFKEELFTNLQIRMPIVVVGGGLTAVDSACEAGAYYIVQIKKFAKKFNEIGREKIWPLLNEEEKIIAEEFLNHAAQLKGADIYELLKKWGGVKIIYRKKIQNSPAYRLNHQELNKAFEEGIEFIENTTPIEAEIDSFNHIKNLKCVDEKNIERIFPCKSLIVAAGTTPNLSPVLEDGLNFITDGKYFSEIDITKHQVAITHSARPRDFSVITKIDSDTKKAVSFFGDLHPNFEGNVVKAMASAKLGYKQIKEVLDLLPNPELAPNWHNDFLQKINLDFLARIEKINRLSDHVVEVFVKAPLAAKNTEIGQIFRLQNYHSLAKKVNGQFLVMESVAITALSIDRDQGIISGIVVETGGSTSLIKNFAIGEPCIFMGPSGKPTEIPQNETVLLIGGGRGNQPLTLLAKAFKDNGCKVIFFAGYRKNSYIVRQEKMESWSDIMVFAIEEEMPNLRLNRASSQQFQGTVIDALRNYLGQNSQKIDRIFTIGNDNLMHKIAKLRHEKPIASIAEAPIAITSLNSPMQCMLKGVCSQCLQKRKNKNGIDEYFYSCAEQDQDMDRLDFCHLHQRCEQNSLMEKISKLWIGHLEEAEKKTS